MSDKDNLLSAETCPMMASLKLWCLGRSRRGRVKRLVRSGGLAAAAVLVVCCVVVPVLLHYSTSLQLYLVFRHRSFTDIILSSPEEDLSSPEDFGCPGAHSFYLETDQNVSVGIWHILPQSLLHVVPDAKTVIKDRWFHSTLRIGYPIIIYLHGNKNSKAVDYRVEFYNVLRTLDYHIVTLDYRGFGDSTPVKPSEKGMVTDVKAVYNYYRGKAPNIPIYIYGHSLGTGVACHAVAELCEEGNPPNGLMLQSPFYNLVDELKAHKHSKFLARLPYFEWVVEPLQAMGDTFRNDVHLARVSLPVLILHAKDDATVPFEQGQKLYLAASRNRPKTSSPIKFAEFDESEGLGHNYIHRSPQFLVVIRNFVTNAAGDSA